MGPDDHPGGTQIGATLRDARRRMGLEVREVEERTKIRARYLRALENEDWGALPAPAYVRGFLRTYGSVLGLDGEMLADEFRRRHGEGSTTPGSAPSEPVLSEPRRPGERPSRRGPVIAAIAAAIVILLVVLGTFSSDDEPSGDGQRAGQAGKQNGGGNSGGGAKSGGGNNQRNGGGNNGSRPRPLDKENATLFTRTSMEVCLVAGSNKALIDGQVLAPDTEESFENEAKRYRLDLRNAGVVRFNVGGNNERLEVSGPASFEGDSRGVREIDYAGPDCP